MSSKISLICKNCGEPFERATKEVKRHLKNGRSPDQFFCTLVCVRQNHWKHMTPEEKRAKASHLKEGLKGNTRGKKGDFTRLLSRSKSRKYDFDLDENYLQELWKKQDGKCAITGVDMIHPSDKSIKSPKMTSIDRINSNKGYLKGNVQLVCYSINLAKQDFNQSEFIEFLSEVRQ